MRLIAADAIVETLKEVRKKADSPRRDLDLLILQEMIQLAPTIAPPPNDPLTLEELRGMDGEPVWDSILSVYGFVNVRSFNGKGCIQYVDNWTNPRCLVPDRYYRRRPEEGTV